MVGIARWVEALMRKSELVVVAAGLLVALATLSLIQAVVTYLVGPLIAAFVGDPIFGLNSFTINGSEFRYGAVLEVLIAFGLASGVAYYVVVAYRRVERGNMAQTRSCPECTSRISAAAKRCPRCTAIVQPNVA